MTELEQAILSGLFGDELADLERAARLKRVDASGFTGDRRIRHAREKFDSVEACRLGPRVDLGRWLGTEATPGVRQAGGRAPTRLAAAGLIVRSAAAGGRKVDVNWRGEVSLDASKQFHFFGLQRHLFGAVGVAPLRRL